MKNHQRLGAAASDSSTFLPSNSQVDLGFPHGGTFAPRLALSGIAIACGSIASCPPAGRPAAIPRQSMPICAAGRTDAGRCRANNEDGFLIDLTVQLFAVADGMGGHLAGDVASRLALATIEEFVRQSRTDRQITWPFGLDATLSFEGNQLRNAVQLANQRIYYEARRRADRKGMGSTIVAALVCDRRLLYVSVGDSRVYLFRAGRLRQVSTDDSFAASMLQAGAGRPIVDASPLRHALTNALGAAETLDVKVRQEALEDGDLLLLCSDGLYGPLADHQLQRVLADSVRLDEAASRLMDLANGAGGPDNVTAVLVRHDAADREEAPRRWNA